MITITNTPPITPNAIPTLELLGRFFLNSKAKALLV